MLKIIVNCGPCEEWIGHCFTSLRSQTCRDWEAFVTVDACGDRTYQQAIAARRDDPRIFITRNEQRQYSMRNLVEGIARSNAAPEDIIVCVDGDDWLLHDDSLRIITRTYAQEDCWLTYGSWICNWPHTPGCWPGYPDDADNFRELEWLGTAVRTWKKWLWDRIDPVDFRDRNGKFFRVVEDVAAMFPMMEMSTIRRMRHIAEPILFYNRHSNGAGQVMGDEMEENTLWLRSRPRYKAVDGPPEAPRHSRLTSVARLEHGGGPYGQ
jgi:glycosyltransferase involved in cell wall biosynthesis